MKWELHTTVGTLTVMYHIIKSQCFHVGKARLSKKKGKVRQHISELKHTATVTVEVNQQQTFKPSVGFKVLNKTYPASVHSRSPECAKMCHLKV